MPDRKPILTVTDKVYETPVVTFDKNDFEREIDAHGRVVEVETALRCPCKSKSSGHNRVDCSNCFGSGWVFVDRRQTVALIQSINQTNSKFKEYNLALAGHMNVTMKAKDRLSYMDVIRLTTHTIHHSELLRVRRSTTGEYYAMTAFEIVEVEQMFAFDTSDTPLRRMRRGVDFTVERNKVTLSADFASTIVAPAYNEIHGFTDAILSTRYGHHPAWHIFDSLRAFSVAVKEGCDSRFSEDEMPSHYIAVLPQRLSDAPKYDGTERIDNSAAPAPASNAKYGTTTL